MSIPALLTLEQEQFLSEFYALCSRYKQAGIAAFSHGCIHKHYEVMLLLEIPSAKKKTWTAQV